MISIEALTKRYGDVVALQGLDLRVEAGEVFGLIGPNGAGKTTTLKILATLLQPTSGRVEICGHSLAREARQIRRVIGYMPDFYGVYEDMRVDEYLHFFAAAADIRGKKAEAMVRDVLELTDLTDRRESLVETLSRGMRQRLGLARVLLHDPKVLLLDEPASGLDPRARVEIRMLLQELCAMHKTVVISSHILSELAELCTTMGIIEQGRLLYKGPLSELTRLGRAGPVLHVRVGAPVPAGTGTEPLVEEAAAAEAAGAEAERADEAPGPDAAAPAGQGEAPAAAAPEAATPDTLRARDLLAADPRLERVALLGDTLELRLGSKEKDPSFVPALLIQNGLRVQHFSEAPLTLEDAFMRLTAGTVS